MFSKFKRLLGLLLMIIMMFSLSMPLWADEVLMSRAGLANWLQQATLPLQQKIEALNTKADNLAASIQDLESKIIQEILLKPGDKQAQLSGLGKSKTEILDVAPLIQNGRTLVPLRFIGEVLGAEINWNSATREVTYQTNIRNIKLTVDKQQAVVDGQSINLDTAPVIINGRTLVPLRFVSEWMGAVVRWDDASRTVLIRYYNS